MDKYQTLIEKAKNGFRLIDLPETIKENALTGIEEWLSNEMFTAYTPQIAFLIQSEKWEFLADAFYQVISFGTGGRRGLVGIGPNRINPWTIQASAQGHSQYLIKQYGEDAKTRGVVLAWDVRKFDQKGIYDDSIANPVMDLDGRQLAVAAAKVYAANGIKVYMFEDVRSTPELSFAVRYLNAVAGDVFSASHNLPTDNGKKVYDEFGGQLISPHDQILVDEVTTNVDAIKEIDYKQAENKGLIVTIGDAVDQAYFSAVCALSLSDERDIKILYSPMHGTGLTSVYPVMKKLGFDIKLDPETANLSGAFENVTFNIPNPEVIESFGTALKAADAEGSDLIMNTDPDADRIGVMARHKGEWCFLNGNEIGILLTEYGMSGFRDMGKLSRDSIVIKTAVTTSLIEKMADENKIQCIGDLLVGFKYIGEKMNLLEKKGRMDDFILGTEESHGFIMGNYVRDKDAAGAAIWLGELAARLKKKGRTLVDFLDDIYARYGYCHNYLTEIRLLGAKGIEQIKKIMEHLRTSDIKGFGGFDVLEKIDRWQGDPQPHLSETDTASRNVLILKIDNQPDTTSIRLTVRPSGTEPKLKIYFEVAGRPFNTRDIAAEKEKIVAIREKVERTFMQYCYTFLGVDFPERGFLLFWQLPMNDKLKYFKIEDQIVALKAIPDPGKRRKSLMDQLAFLGANPIEKVDRAFTKKYKAGILEYLGLA